MPKTVILGAARTPIGKLGGGLGVARRHRARRHRDRRRARARRRRARAGRARGHGPGAPGRPGPDPLAPGADQGRHPEGGLLGDDQQGLRLGPARRRCMLDQAIRAGDVEVGVGGGMESMSQRALPAARRALRLPHGRRQGARRDGPRRADATRSPASRCSTRPPRSATSSSSRAPTSTAGRCARTSARIAGDRRGPAARGDRPGDDQGPQGRHGRRGRRGAAPRLVARGAGEAAGPGRQGRARTPPATRPASTTAPARSCSPRDEWARAQRQGGRWPRSSPTPRAPTTSPTSRRRPAQRGEEGARQGRPRRRATSTCGRSTRRSPRSP